VNAFASNACIEVNIISLEEWNRAYIRAVKDEDYNEVQRESVEWKALSEETEYNRSDIITRSMLFRVNANKNLK
jgi:hypothetical protein